MTHETTRGNDPARQEAIGTETNAADDQEASESSSDDHYQHYRAARDATADVDAEGDPQPAGMPKITVRVPAALRETIDAQVERGIYPNRSEAVRDALEAAFVATDGGHQIDPEAWYVYDSQRDAVVDGPIATKGIAQQAAADQGLDYLVVDGSALESIQGDTRLVWETGDVDVVTDGGWSR